MDYLMHVLVISGIYSLLSMSLNLIVGYTGMPALGHAAFFCVGAYTSALLSLKLGFSPWIGLAAGFLFSAFTGFISSFPALRLKDDYLALATLSFNIIIYGIVKNWVSLTRGPMGLPGIPEFTIFVYRIEETWHYLILVIFFNIVVFLALYRIVYSPFGRLLKGIRDDELAVQVLGVNTVKYKIWVFVLGAGIAGLAGVIYAHYMTFIDPSSFTIMESITVLLMVIFGGMANLYGSILGAIVLVMLPELLRFIGLPLSIAAPLRQMLYGLLLVILVIKKPQGILGEYKIK